MINYVLYEDNKDNMNEYIKIINKFMLNKSMDYKILTFSKYTNKISKIINKSIDGRKIYILDVEVPGMNGIDLARAIRNSDDWNSQIIIVTAYDKEKYYSLTDRLLMLNFISKYDLANELVLSLNIAWKIFFNDKVLSYKYNSEIFNIFYNDIYYIEKNLHNNDSTIITCDNKYIIRSSINELVKIFSGDNRFFKTHRSCIVNINNIVSYDISSNIIKFKKGEIDLVSRNKKQEFKDLLYDRNNF